MLRTNALLILLFAYQAGAQTPALAVGDSLYQIGAYSQAISVYEQIPVSPEVYERIGLSYETLGNTNKALSAYKNALLLDKDNFKTAYKYGTLLRNQGNYKSADSLFGILNKKQPTNASVLYQMGYVKEQLEDSTAVIDYMRAYQLDDNQQNALYRLSKILLEKRNFVSAKEFIDKGLQSDQNSTRFILLDALNFYVNKSYHKAITAYERLLDLGKDNRSVREKLAVSYATTYQYEQAIENYKILINKYDDQNANWHYTIGKCFLGLNEPEKARRHINIAIGLLDVPLDDQFVTLAITYNREGKYARVMENLKMALKENPNNERARIQLAIAADNRFDDKSKVLPYYEAYARQFEKGRNIEMVNYRISDIKKELFMTED